METATDAGSVAYQAAKWQANTRTIDRWRAAGAPLHDDLEMARWIIQQPRSPAPSVRIARSITSKAVGTGAGDSDVADFEKSYTPAAEKDNLAAIKREVAYYHFKILRCRERGDATGEAEAVRHFRSMSDLLHDLEIRNQRLGREIGESFGAEDVDRLGRAVAFWLMNSADGLIGQIAAGLVAASAAGPLGREQVRKVIEPLVLEARVMEPMVRAAKVNAPIKLPQRFVDAMREGIALVAEDGAAEFSALYALPVPVVVE